MKENWIKKIIELLNEYEKENWRNFEVTEIWMIYRNNDLMVISKKYWFIKWLVQKNKINFDKVMKLWIPCFVQYDKWEIISVHDVDFDRQLIMLLSISDTPIEDLISYLK